MKRLSVLLMLSILAVPAAAQLDNLQTSHAAQPERDGSQEVSLAIEERIFEALGSLADTIDVETVRCLIGTVEGEQAVIDLAWEPPIHASTRTNVRFTSCPRATLALWHNHLWNGKYLPEDACYLSRVDIEEAMRPNAPEVHIVQVSVDVACWWTRRQIARHSDASVVWPVPSQQRGSTVANTVANANQSVQRGDIVSGGGRP